MSHKWIGASLKEDMSISITHKNTISTNIIIAQRNFSYPTIYNREIYMVTGKQYEQHDRSKGKVHNIQMPLVVLPDNILVE